MPTTVSIILPTYNRADTIVRAIESVQAQTFQDWELIVVDDGSTDGTAELIENLEPRMVL
ncbi:MAG TPA: glycosyltransferase, partial [Candidatus Angelobacter sp.]|nr:glycosyltransferase [Candidatus Angelobacter sp.]